eukprot:s3031_g2.t1
MGLAHLRLLVLALGAAEDLKDSHLEFDCKCWAAQGQCASNPSFMLASCAASCARHQAYEVLMRESEEAKTSCAARMAGLESELANKAIAVEEAERQAKVEAAANAAKVSELEQRLRVADSSQAGRVAELEAELANKAKEVEEAQSKARVEAAANVANAAKVSELEQRLKVSADSSGAGKLAELESELANKAKEVEEAQSKARVEAAANVANAAKAKEVEEAQNRARVEAAANVAKAAKVSELEQRLKVSADSSGAGRLVELEAELANKAKEVEEAQNQARVQAAAVVVLEQKLSSSAGCEPSHDRVGATDPLEGAPSWLKALPEYAVAAWHMWANVPELVGSCRTLAAQSVTSCWAMAKPYLQAAALCCFGAAYPGCFVVVFVASCLGALVLVLGMRCLQAIFTRLGRFLGRSHTSPAFASKMPKDVGSIGTMSGVPGYGKELKQNKLQGRGDVDLSRIEGRLDRLEHTLIDRLERIAAAVPRVQAAGPSAAPAAAAPVSVPSVAVVPAQVPPAGTVPAPMPAAVPPAPVAMTGKGPPATRPAPAVSSSPAPGFARSPLPNSSPTPSRPQAGPPLPNSSPTPSRPQAGPPLPNSSPTPSRPQAGPPLPNSSPTPSRPQAGSPARPVPAKVDASPMETNVRKAPPTPPPSVPPSAPTASAEPSAVRGARASPFAEPTEKVCLEGEV